MSDDTKQKKVALTETEITQQIEQAAYYCYLNRERYAQAGDKMCDWAEAEKEVWDSLTEP
jgi:hypothetical protein